MDNPDIPISSLRIGLGDNNLVKIYDEEKYAEIEKAIVPEGYREIYSLSEDVALIQLKKSLKFSKSVQPACLPTEPQEVYEGALKVNSRFALFMFTHYSSYSNTIIVIL